MSIKAATRELCEEEDRREEQAKRAQGQQFASKLRDLKSEPFAEKPSRTGDHDEPGSHGEQQNWKKRRVGHEQCEPPDACTLGDDTEGNCVKGAEFSGTSAIRRNKLIDLCMNEAGVRASKQEISLNM